jgi:hypothetical protein
LVIFKEVANGDRNLLSQMVGSRFSRIPNTPTIPSEEKAIHKKTLR